MSAEKVKLIRLENVQAISGLKSSKICAYISKSISSFVRNNAAYLNISSPKIRPGNSDNCTLNFSLTHTQSNPLSGQGIIYIISSRIHEFNFFPDLSLKPGKEAHYKNEFLENLNQFSLNQSKKLLSTFHQFKSKTSNCSSLQNCVTSTHPTHT